MGAKPKVLIIDALGDVGRSLLGHILRNDLSDHILVACKRLPALSFLTEDQENFFKDSRVEYHQCNINDPKSVVSCITKSDKTPYDYVFNLDAHDIPAGIADDKIAIEPSIALGKECARVGVKAFFKLSAGDVYDKRNDAKSKEDSKIKPKTTYGTICSKIDKELMKINNLNVVILRASMIYGPTSTANFVKYMSIAYIHKYTQKTMRLLGSEDDKKNTVHSDDVARAAWGTIAVKEHGGLRDSPLKGKEVYNISDEFNMDQRKLCVLFENTFGISTGFQDYIVSKIANINLKTAADYINAEVKDPWAEMCKKAQTLGTPLSPFVDKNFLASGCNIDSSKLKETFKFSLVYPEPTTDILKSIITNLTLIKVWPAV